MFRSYFKFLGSLIRYLSTIPPNDRLLSTNTGVFLRSVKNPNI